MIDVRGAAPWYIAPTWPGESAHRGQSNMRISSEAGRSQKHSISVDQFLEFLHWERLHGLGRWLGLEDAWLLGERIHTFALVGLRRALLAHVGGKVTHLLLVYPRDGDVCVALRHLHLETLRDLHHHGV